VTHHSIKILHTEASQGWGGQEIRILTEAKGMISRGYHVTIVSPKQAPIYHEAIKNNIPAVALPIEKKSIHALLRIYKYIQKQRPDIINTHSSTDSWLFGIAIKLLHSPPPIIRTRHISAPISTGFFSRWLYTRSAKHIITTGSKLRAQLINVNNFPATNITSIPTGIDQELFKPGSMSRSRNRLGLDSNAIIIGIVATIRSWKGHIYLAEAFKNYSQKTNKNCILLVVGDGPAKESFQSAAKKLGIIEQVVMAGNQRNVSPWLHTMNYFVLPSYANEGVPQSILQAMMCKIPVITTNIGSITDAIIANKTGIIVDPKNPAMIERALIMLGSDPALKDYIINNAHHHALTNFSLKIMLDKTEGIIKKKMQQEKTQ